MLKNLLGNIAWKIYYPNMLRYLKEFKDEEFLPIEILEQRQDEALRRFINHAFKNIPYYRELSRDLKIKAEDIRCKKDLECFPILTKTIIKDRLGDFFWDGEKRYKNGETSGSTGEALQYRMSLNDYYRGRALQLRTFTNAGYKIGDQLFIMGGSSLTGNETVRKNIINIISNYSVYKSYRFEQSMLKNVYLEMKNREELFIYGYPSSIYIFSDYILNKGYKLDIAASIFTTAEVLLPYYRETIKKAFPNCQVFDNYGMNDGSLHAGECNYHNGMHISYGRGLMEIVDEQNKQITEQEGRVLATSIYNYAFPFIRYEVGDLATITHKPCGCGRKTPRLLSIQGRQTDYLEINEIKISGHVLTVLLRSFPELKMYRVIQKDDRVVLFKICLEPSHNNEKARIYIENIIKESFLDKIPDAEIKFEYFNKPLDLMRGANKYRIVINETLKNKT